jgi:hypothetical protein
MLVLSLGCHYAQFVPMRIQCLLMSCVRKHLCHPDHNNLLVETQPYYTKLCGACGKRPVNCYSTLFESRNAGSVAPRSCRKVHTKMLLVLCLPDILAAFSQ